MIDSSRRSFLARGVIAALALVGAIAQRAAAGLRASDSPNATTHSYGKYCGNYRVDSDHIVGIDYFILEDSGEPTLLIADYKSGVVRRLFPVSQTEFVMGPGFGIQSPVELNVRFVTNEQGDVTAISLRPSSGTASVAERIALNQEDVIFHNGNVTLAGTLIEPTTKGPHPAIILLHGSGALTRYSFGPYPHFFTSLGFAVLIFDKRGTGESTGTRLDASTGALSQLPAAYYPDGLVEDALAAIRFLRSRKEINPNEIGVWGSSEGGMLTTQVAAREKDVAFAINSSGFMDPLWETLDYQVGAVLRVRGATEATVKEALAFERLWMRVAQTGENYELFLKARQEALRDNKPWLLSWVSDEFTSLEQMRWDWDHILAFSPLPALKRVTCPVLGVFGELDVSTNAAVAAENMRAALSDAGNRDVTLKIFPNANHSLAEMPSGNRMAPGVFETLRSWLLARI